MPQPLPFPPNSVPPGTRIGHVHLQVTDLDRALAFYQGLLGFEVMVHIGSAAFLSADGYHHIGLNTWHSRAVPHAQPVAGRGGPPGRSIARTGSSGSALAGYYSSFPPRMKPLNLPK